MGKIIILFSPVVSNLLTFIWIPILLAIFYLLGRFLRSYDCKDCGDFTIGKNKDGDPQCKGCRWEEIKFHNLNVHINLNEEQTTKNKK